LALSAKLGPDDATWANVGDPRAMATGLSVHPVDLLSARLYNFGNMKRPLPPPASRARSRAYLKLPREGNSDDMDRLVKSEQGACARLTAQALSLPDAAHVEFGAAGNVPR